LRFSLQRRHLAGTESRRDGSAARALGLTRRLGGSLIEAGVIPIRFGCPTVGLEKPLDEIREADLQRLIENQVSEQKTMEYKRDLPGRSDEQRKDFLADVSSFANAVGGHLIYGMAAESGVPMQLIGVEAEADATILALESSIRSGVAPRIPGVQMRGVGLQNGRNTFVVRVPESFAAPHMLTYKGTSRFFSRTSNGKYQLDVAEIRSAFLLSETAAERIREFRAERIAKLLAEVTPLQMEGGARIVLHIVPLGAFAHASQIDISKSVNDVLRHLTPIYHSGFSNHRYTFDGYLTYHTQHESQHADAHLQLYRNGIIESVDASFLEPYDNEMIIASLPFEQRLIERLGEYLQVLERLRIEPPFIVMLSLLGVSMYGLVFGSRGGTDFFDRNNLILPEVLLENFGVDVAATLKPAFDSVWNSAGRPGSPYYKGTKWIGK